MSAYTQGNIIFTSLSPTPSKSSNFPCFLNYSPTSFLFFFSSLLSPMLSQNPPLPLPSSWPWCSPVYKVFTTNGWGDLQPYPHVLVWMCRCTYTCAYLYVEALGWCHVFSLNTVYLNMCLKQDFSLNLKLACTQAWLVNQLQELACHSLTITGEKDMDHNA